MCYVGSTIQSLEDRLKEHEEDLENFKNKTSGCICIIIQNFRSWKTKN
ncbi:MAG: hypothetical protein ACXVHS_09850 [Methanobacterium sp.]